MTSTTATVVIVLQGATLVVTLGLLGGAIFLGRKAKREAAAARAKYDHLKQATARFASDLNNLF